MPDGSNSERCDKGKAPLWLSIRLQAVQGQVVLEGKARASLSEAFPTSRGRGLRTRGWAAAILDRTEIYHQGVHALPDFIGEEISLQEMVDEFGLAGLSEGKAVDGERAENMAEPTGGPGSV